jgi:hypothetical protein
MIGLRHNGFDLKFRIAERAVVQSRVAAIYRVPLTGCSRKGFGFEAAPLSIAIVSILHDFTLPSAISNAENKGS